MNNFSKDSRKELLNKNGFLVITDLLTDIELNIYRQFYQSVMDGDLKIMAQNHRHDLGSHKIQQDKNVENITQIMWPSLYLPMCIENSPIHTKTKELAKSLLGNDMVFDFDMLITKEPFTNTETPWHSDESYWLDMPDKRALSFWIPMCDVDINNGCMWFVPGSHLQPLRKHRPVKVGEHVQMTDDCTNKEGTPQPLHAGGCTVHTGRTLHYTAGNQTSAPRRVYIVNYRPKEMVEYERKNNFDHGKHTLNNIIKSKTAIFSENY